MPASAAIAAPCVAPVNFSVAVAASNMTAFGMCPAVSALAAPMSIFGGCRRVQIAIINVIKNKTQGSECVNRLEVVIAIMG